jgi:branched-chain amino acid transport system ATP-binding protein
MLMLDVEKMCAAYGASQILFDIDLKVDKAETVCILGRNGVGKTTSIKAINGVCRPKSGSVKFEGNEIAGLPPYKISRLGIAYIPQGRHIFPNLTTRENLLIADRKGGNPEAKWDIKKIYELFPVLKERDHFRGRSLSGGEQQMLTIARGLMQNPKLLLMDEITEGLAPLIIKELEEVVQELKKSGVSILLAEQNIAFAMATSSRCYILEKGQVVFSGNTAEITLETISKYLATE